MDYGKSGAAKVSGNKPRFETGKGAPKAQSGKDARGGKASREELLARMKAAAQKRKQD
jgi:hypothetical protein